MLSDFFKLNPPFEVFDELKLVNHFKTSHDLRSVLYQPDTWPRKPKQFKQMSFSNVSFSKTTFSEITFTECSFEDCLFIGAHFAKTDFHRCEFINCNFYKANFDTCYIDPGTIVFDKRYRRIAANVGVDTYQQLFENSSKARQTDFARIADFEFRRWKRWQLRFDQKAGKISRLDRVLKTGQSVLYEWSAGFGYKPWRFVIATILVFTAVSVLNMNTLPGALQHDGRIIGHLTLADSIFYTYSMMTVLGFSTITPETNFAKLLAVSEALVGIGWLGIFTSLLVKRFIK